MCISLNTKIYRLENGLGPRSSLDMDASFHVAGAHIKVITKGKEAHWEDNTLLEDH